MMQDPVLAERALRKKQGVHALLWIALLGVFAASLFMYYREFGYEGTDLHVHAMIARDFDFSDLHSITSRLSYPLWHLAVSALYQLGMPIAWAAAAVCAFFKALTLLFTQRLLVAITHGKIREWAATLAAVALMVVTAISLPPWFNQFVYRGVGSPNVWHNPTQQAVTAAMLLCVPYLAHCWYEFERLLPQQGDKTMLPWRKVVMLAALLMASLACKPTFMQALLPAAFVMFLVELLRHKRQWRYFGQIVLAFLPAVGYFLLQYLYYTGVVVEFTSGVEFGVTLKTMWDAVRNTLMMSAFPFLVIACCYRRGMFKDRMLVLGLLMTLFSVLEAMAFRETGMRMGHGNFTWAANSSSFFLWVVATGIFLRSFARERVKDGSALLKRAGYGLCWTLFAWHLASGVYYLYFLLTTSNAF